MGIQRDPSSLEKGIFTMEFPALTIRGVLVRIQRKLHDAAAGVLSLPFRRIAHSYCEPPVMRRKLDVRASMRKMTNSTVG